MNKKLHRVLDEIQKTEEKIAAWQEHLGELFVLEGVQNGTVVLSEKPEMTDDSDSDKGTEPENPTESAEDMDMAEMTGNQVETAENTADGLFAEQGLPEGAAAEREDF